MENRNAGLSSEQEILMETQDWLWKEKCRRSKQFLILWNKEYYGLEVKNIKQRKEHDMSLNREGKNLFLVHSL
jgi:hypothetical protein